MKQNTLAVEQLNLNRNQRTVLNDVTFSAFSHSLIGIVGPNSAGKSSLLKAIAGLLPVSCGIIKIKNKPLDKYDPIALAQTLAYMPQSPEVHWPLSVEDIVALGRLPYHQDWSVPVAAEKNLIDSLIRDCELDSLRQRKITELSGGEQTRALLARTLAVDAPLLLADEPVSHLDPYFQILFMQKFRQLADSGSTVLIVLHDLNLAARFCDTIYLLDQGHLVAGGPPAQVLTEQNIQQVYGVTLLNQPDQFGTLVIPWERRPSATAGVHARPESKPAD